MVKGQLLPLLAGRELGQGPHTGRIGRPDVAGGQPGAVGRASSSLEWAHVGPSQPFLGAPGLPARQPSSPRSGSAAWLDTATT